MSEERESDALVNIEGVSDKKEGKTFFVKRNIFIVDGCIIGLILLIGIILLITCHNKTENSLVKAEFELISGDEGIEIPIFDKTNLELGDKEFYITIDGKTRSEVSHTFAFNTNGTHKIEIVFKKKMKTINGMFNGCDKLVKANFTYLLTDEIENMDNVFSGCTSLNETIFGNDFNTPKLISLSGMFKNCITITELNMSKFDTPLAKNMDEVFSGCSGIKTLDIRNFNSASLETYNQMFDGIKGAEISYNSGKLKGDVIKTIPEGNTLIDVNTTNIFISS